MDGDDVFGVVANVRTDASLRLGAKVWIVDGWGGGAWERVYVRGLSRPGETIRKWIAAKALENIRVAWVPEHLREKVRIGDRPSAESLCAVIEHWGQKETDNDDQD